MKGGSMERVTRNPVRTGYPAQSNGCKQDSNGDVTQDVDCQMALGEAECHAWMAKVSGYSEGQKAADTEKRNVHHIDYDLGRYGILKMFVAHSNFILYGAILHMLVG